jgi:vacuolar-type H+-ATPase subunit I/STV1
MGEISLEEQVQRLDERVSYLEDKLDDSYSDHMSRRRVKSVFPNDADVELNSSRGYFRGISYEVDIDEINSMISRISKKNGLDCEVVENGNGIGIEVWTNGR